ncbi:MAG: NAD-dependent epimerase/dehydratase family protein [Alphaproteobacteria bacterium]
MSRYLVTGGCGFIGSHLVDSLLADGHEVAVLDDLSTGRRSNLDPRARLVVADVADTDAVSAAMANVSACFHLAAVASVQRSTEEWPKTHRSNQTGSIAVFDAARRLGGGTPLPVVFASSAAVYGSNTAVPLAETAQVGPISPYGADKLGSELHARAGEVIHRSRIIGLRFFNVFGPRQDPGSPYSGVISIFSDRSRQGLPLTIFGCGEQTRDFVFVSDVVGCLRRAMASLEASPAARFAAYNVCRGVGVTINELARHVVAASGSSSTISHAPARAGDIQASIGVPDLARRDLGFVAAVSLEDGLRATLGWAPPSVAG